MELLIAQVEPDTIRLVGRWRINTLLRYLHTTAKSFTEGIDAIIFEHGTCALISTAHARK